MTKKKKPEAPPLTTKEVLAVMRRVGKPMTVRDVLKAFRLHKMEKPRIFAVMEELEAAGKVIVTRGNAFGLVDEMHLVTGRLEVQRSGVGFVIPEDPRRKTDIFVPPQDFGGAWHGDKVAVAVTRERHGRNPLGRIVRVLERRMEEIPCRTDRSLGKGLVLCQPTDPRQHAMFMVPFPEDQKPESGLIVQVKPGNRVDRELWEGEAVRILGPETDVSVQEAMVKQNHGVPTRFPSAALDEAKELPDVPSEADMKGREDLRGLSFVTIDGAKARDFDDAIYVEKRPGGWMLWVAIADVSHYVAPGSALDREAIERANSYYFPLSVEPMFPPALSNGLCSLNPEVPRLAMVARMEYSAEGKPGPAAFSAAVIKSKARLTYSQVGRIVLDKDEEERKKVAHVLPMLEEAYALALRINKQRKERGSLDFDLPEPEILFNLQGETVDIRRKVRHFGHQIIEEFMIAANEAVAEFLESVGPEPLFRVHEAPDPEKIRSLYKVVSLTELAAKVPEETTPQALQALLTAARGTEQEFMVNRLTLRTMMQARYQPENVGHFGLASTCYCHFTSPIRRYADLQVHRALKRALSLPGGAALPVKRLRDLGNHLSSQERVAMEAEREIMKRVAVLFLRGKVGQEFTGVISGMADFGFWVELNEVMAEGLVRLSLLADDYYNFLPERQMLLGERSGRFFRLGQSVKVLLREVNLGRLEVDLVPVEDAPRITEAEREMLYLDPPSEPRWQKQAKPKGETAPAGKGGKAGAGSRRAGPARPGRAKSRAAAGKSGAAARKKSGRGRR